MQALKLRPKLRQACPGMQLAGLLLRLLHDGHLEGLPCLIAAELQLTGQLLCLALHRVEHLWYLP